MSWWVYLEDHKAAPWCSFGKPSGEDGDGPCPWPCYPSVSVHRHMDGGTYVLGGTEDAEMNITYNYSGHFHGALGTSLREFLHDKRAADVARPLKAAAEKLGTEKDCDYWAATPGNAGHVLAILALWAEQYPDAIFRVS